MLSQLTILRKNRIIVLRFDNNFSSHYIHKKNEEIFSKCFKTETSKVSVVVQKLYLNKIVIQETNSKSTCNMKCVWNIKKTRKYDIGNWLFS